MNRYNIYITSIGRKVDVKFESIPVLKTQQIKSKHIEAKAKHKAQSPIIISKFRQIKITSSLPK